MPRTVIVAYKPKSGNKDALRVLLEAHVGRLRAEGLATGRSPVLLEASDGTLIEIFEWLSEQAIQTAHLNTAVQQMWAEFAEVCDYVPLKDLKEAGDLFAAFTPVN